MAISTNCQKKKLPKMTKPIIALTFNEFRTLASVYRDPKIRKNLSKGIVKLIMNPLTEAAILISNQVDKKEKDHVWCFKKPGSTEADIVAGSESDFETVTKALNAWNESSMGKIFRSNPFDTRAIERKLHTKNQAIQLEHDLQNILAADFPEKLKKKTKLCIGSVIHREESFQVEQSEIMSLAGLSGALREFEVYLFDILTDLKTARIVSASDVLSWFSAYACAPSAFPQLSNELTLANKDWNRCVCGPQQLQMTQILGDILVVLAGPTSMGCLLSRLQFFPQDEIKIYFGKLDSRKFQQVHFEFGFELDELLTLFDVNPHFESYRII